MGSRSVRGTLPGSDLWWQQPLTVGTLHALRVGRRSLALVGFDDFELADLLEVSVVRTDPYQLGAELAFARMDGDTRRTQRVVVPVELVTRGSGEP